MLSVIVCTYNRQKYLYALLKCIAGNTYPPDRYELLVIDNRSTDDTPALCRQFAQEYPQINFRYAVELKQGIPHARNKGLAISRGDILLYVEDDALVDTLYLQHYADFFERHPRVQAAGGRIEPIYEQGTEPPWMSRFTRELLTTRLDLGKKIRPFRRGYFPGGGNAAYRRSVFEQVGSFNPLLGRKGKQLLAGEEKDLFSKMAARGIRPWYIPQAILYHIIPPSKLTEEHFRRTCFSVGQSEQLRTRCLSKGEYYKRLLAELYKWAASLILCTGFFLSFRPSKGVKLLQFRYGVSKGLLRPLNLPDRPKAGTAEDAANTADAATAPADAAADAANTPPRISVIMAARNVQNYIREAVESVLNQQGPSIELIITDDASQDNTPTIIKQMAALDPRIRLIQNTSPQGSARARNSALAIARAPVIAILDADDIALPKRLQRQERYLQKHPRIDLLASYARRTDSRLHYGKKIKFPTRPQALRASMLFTCSAVHSSMAIRHDFLKRHHLQYNPSFSCSQDYELWSRALQCGARMATLPRVLCLYRHTPRQISRTDKQEQDDRAAQVSRSLLRRMGFEGNDTQVAQHLRFSLRSKETGPVSELLDWAGALSRQNRISSVYSQRALDAEIALRFLRYTRKNHLPLLQSLQLQIKLHKRLCSCVFPYFTALKRLSL